MTSNISAVYSFCYHRDYRYINKQKRRENKLSLTEIESGCRLGIDTHADTTCAGKHVRIIERIDGPLFDVSPFNGPPVKNIGLINGIVAVDREDGHSGYILEVNNALDFTTSMEHSLLCPMQARVNGIKIDDVPKSIDPSSSQSIILNTDGDSIPIYYNGPIPYINMRYPTSDDMDTFKWLPLTHHDSWEPYKENFNISSSTTFEPSYFRSDISDPFYDSIQSSVIISSLRREGKANTILTPEILSQAWHIPLNLAKRTMDVTEYKSIRSQEGKLSRRFRTNTYQRRYRRLGGPFSRFYTDTLFSKVKSISGNTCAQIYSNRIGFTKLYPMDSKSNAHNSFSTLIHEVGIPHELHSDHAKELTEGEFKKKLNKYEVYQTTTEPHSPWQNDAERKIGMVKRLGRYFMQSTQSPIRIWDYAYVFAANIISVTAANTDSFNRTPFEYVMGFTPDIAELASFRWHQWVWYWDPEDIQKQKIGKWCGVANTCGSGHTYYILNSNGKMIVRSTISHLTEDETIGNKELLTAFNRDIAIKIGTYNSPAYVKGETLDQNNPYSDLIVKKNSQFDDEEDETIEFMPTDTKGTFNSGVPEADETAYEDNLSNEFGDKYIGAKVLLPNGDVQSEATVLSRKRSADGTHLIGKANSNPLLDTRVYNVEFNDGTIDEYSANLIAESIYSNTDVDRNTYSIIEGIIDHRTNQDAVPLSEGTITMNGRRKKRITTKGWELLIRWKDGSQSWLPLKDVKEANPLQTAEYAISRDIHNEPAFAWWVNQVLRTRSRIISRLKATRQIKHRVKFGVQVPNTIDEALSLDSKNGNSLWRDAINKELDKVRVAFQLLKDGESPPVGSKQINYHIIFEVKMDLTRKARLVAGGHLNKNVPKHTTYSSVVSRESVRICFTLAALNNLDVLSGDISNAYLHAKPLEKCHVTINDDILFGPSAKGKVAVICRALYGMKSSGNAWRLHFANILEKDLQFKQCVADNDVWYREGKHPDGSKFYHYICIYVDDILVISNQPKSIMLKIGEHFLLKDNSVGSPKMYLGTDTKLRLDDSGLPQYWILGSNSYLKEALRIVKETLSKSGVKVSGRGRQPYSSLSYRPELDTSAFCNPEQHNMYHGLIGMLRWLIELGRLDINLEVSQLSTYLASPRIGHLHQAFHIFHYLKNHDSSWLPMDPQRLDLEYKGPEENSPNVRRNKMKLIYRDAMDEVPNNAPNPRGKPVQCNIYVDADHAGNKVTRKSQTGILVFLNMAPISWFSKRQNTVESSTFSSEYIALKIAVEKIISLRYKLRMMGVPLDGPANIFCDNESVVKSNMNPESTLKRKNVSIAYHKCRESFAAGIVDIYFQYSSDNLADLSTKVLPVPKQKEIFRCIFV